MPGRGIEHGDAPRFLRREDFGDFRADALRRIGETHYREQGDEPGGQPRPAGIAAEVCDHANAPHHLPLAFDDAHEARCGRRVQRTFEQLDDRAAILVGRAIAVALDGEGVAGGFAVGLHAPQAQPDDGIEPVQHLQERHEPVHRQVEPADVCHFMQEDVAQFRSGEIAGETGGEEQLWAQETEDGGAVNGAGLPRDERATQAHAHPAHFQQAEDVRIGETGRGADAALHFPGDEKDARREQDDADGPDEDQGFVPGEGGVRLRLRRGDGERRCRSLGHRQGYRRGRGRGFRFDIRFLRRSGGW
ncbi:MAG: hypothetical protein ABJF10_11465 [Chthoniobacter sp.]|uniref:hypothetical protein n=1 Tax=Chthoniobacter sp. TaxID=2510640 RepID=UPI0032A52F1B